MRTAVGSFLASHACALTLDNSTGMATLLCAPGQADATLVVVSCSGALGGGWLLELGAHELAAAPAMTTLV